MINNIYLSGLIAALASVTFSGAYQLVWNIPHQSCINICGLDLTPEIASYGFLVNSNGQFQGSEISLIYTPGNFSRLANTTGTAKTPMELTRINGGVPQLGNLTRHLGEFEAKINLQVPDVNYAGLLVLDFEDWRPIYRLNFGSLSKYQNVSQELVLLDYPEWSSRPDLVLAEATARFEEGARNFMEATIRKALEMRPNSKAGYYLYPLCFNTAVTTSCPIDAININNNMTWLFGVNTAMFPSIYLGQRGYTEVGRAQMVFVRITEAVRVGTNNGNVAVWAYATYKYADTYVQITDTDMINALTQPKLAGAAGSVLWGSSSDLRTADRCFWLQNYLRTVLGPLALQLVDVAPITDPLTSIVP